LIFTPEPVPFPYWDGPYTPARGSYSGFRIRGGILGAWVSSDDSQSFCEVQRSDGVKRLTDLISRHWSGGRLLFLPSGLIVKPLQNEDERGARVVVGRYEGKFSVLVGNNWFDFLAPSLGIAAGSVWDGPGTIGLECSMKGDGSLSTSWEVPSEFGAEGHQNVLSGPNKTLLDGFKAARPNDQGGRVRVTVGGHVLTKREMRHGWKTFYVGRVAVDTLQNWDNWKRRR
jgi:hypothetical protein